MLAYRHSWVHPVIGAANQIILALGIRQVCSNTAQGRGGHREAIVARTFERPLMSIVSRTALRITPLAVRAPIQSRENLRHAFLGRKLTRVDVAASLLVSRCAMPSDVSAEFFLIFCERWFR